MFGLAKVKQCHGVVCNNDYRPARNCFPRYPSQQISINMRTMQIPIAAYSAGISRSHSASTVFYNVSDDDSHQPTLKVVEEYVTASTLGGLVTIVIITISGGD